MRILRGTIVGVIVLTACEIVVGMLFPPKDLPAAPGTMLLWGVLSNIIWSAVIAWLTLGSRRRGAPLALTLIVVTLLANQVSSLMEAVFFHVLSVSVVLGILPNVVLPQIVAAFAIVWATGTWSAPAQPGPGDAVRWGGLVARGALVAAIYVVCYFAAGILVFPYVRDFYMARALPPGGLVAAVQFFVRGPMFAVAIAMLVWQMPTPRAQHAVAGALLMCVIGGLAPLLVPNPLLPDAIRYAHMVEVVCSNLVFGGVAGWLLSPRRGTLPSPSASYGAAGKESAPERVS
jgi:hypothetical protein